IQDARQQRKQNGLQEMERLRERGESNRRRRSWLQALIVLIPAFTYLIYRLMLLQKYFADMTPYLRDSSEFSGRFTSLLFSVIWSSGLVVVIALLFAIFIVLRAR